MELFCEYAIEDNYAAQIPKDLWHFEREYAYFSDSSKNFPMHKVSLLFF